MSSSQSSRVAPGGSEYPGALDGRHAAALSAHGCYLSVAECAALLAVDHKTVRRLIRDGRLPALDVGTPGRPLYRINPDDVSRLRATTTPPTPKPDRTRPPTRRPSGEFSRRAREARDG